MIWDFIRDFLVQYIFGGTDSLGDKYSNTIGNILSINGEDYVYMNELNTDYFVPFGGYDYNNDYPVNGISLGDWLSTTATIIIMCIAVFLMIMLVRWVWRLVTSAFLLK